MLLGQGQTLAILGPNGAGKSTLLKALAGNLPLSSGDRNEGEGLKLGVFTQARSTFKVTSTITVKDKSASRQVAYG